MKHQKVIKTSYSGKIQSKGVVIDQMSFVFFYKLHSTAISIYIRLYHSLKSSRVLSQKVNCQK